MSDNHPSLSNTTILIVDDNDLNQIVLKKILDDAGAQVEIAINGAYAVRKLEEGYRPDIILLDLHMPVLDGFQTSSTIRKKLNLAIPILVVSGSIEPYEHWRLKRLGIHDYIEKPFTRKEILHAITQALNHENKLRHAG